MMDRTRPWTEQEGLGSAGSSVAAPPKNEGLPGSAACWAVRVLLAFLTHGSRLSFGGPARHRAPSAVSSGPGLKCLHALKMGHSFTDSPEPYSPVGLSLPRAQHRSHASRAERGAALSEPRLRSCVCFPGTGAGGEGEEGQSRSEKAAGPRAPLACCLPSVAMCSQGLISLSQAKIKRITFLRQPAPSSHLNPRNAQKPRAPAFRPPPARCHVLAPPVADREAEPHVDPHPGPPADLCPGDPSSGPPHCGLSASVLANCHPVPMSPAAPSRQGAERVRACECVCECVCSRRGQDVGSGRNAKMPRRPPVCHALRSSRFLHEVDATHSKTED